MATCRAPRRRRHGKAPAAAITVSSMACGDYRAACLAAPSGVVLDHRAVQLVQLLAIGVLAVAGPSAVAAEVPAAYLIAHAQAHQSFHVRDMPRVDQPDQGLHPTIEVAVHQVGAADEDDRIACAAEDEQPRVLQEPAQNRAYPDVLGQALDARTEGADAPYPEVDLDPGARCPVQRINHLIVDDRVELETDVAAEALSRVLDLGVDVVDQTPAYRTRCHQKTPEPAARCPSRELVEQPGQVLADLWVAGEQPEVRIQAGGLGVVVAGTDVAVAAQPLGLLADHQGELRVGLEADDPVDHVDSGVLE